MVKDHHKSITSSTVHYIVWAFLSTQKYFQCQYLMRVVCHGDP